MANTRTSFPGQWNTFHANGPFPLRMLLDTRLEPKADMPSPFARYNDAALEIQRLLQESLNSNERFRAYGSGWSLNNIAHQQDRMHFNQRLNLKFAIAQTQMHANTAHTDGSLFFFQCGNVIKEVSEFARANGRSISASGASNGQTIAGAISTGVHGAALDFGAVQDMVVGLNLIIGPRPEDNVYLESEHAPALSDAFANTINARVIRNEGLFRSALVGLGAFGFVHGVAIATEERFLLKRYIRKINKTDALQLGETLDFANARFTLPEELDANGKGDRPYHYKLLINPYNAAEDYVIELMYRKPYRNGYPNPLPRVRQFLYRDVPTWIGWFAARHNRHIPRLLELMKGEIFPQDEPDVEGTIGELFWDSNFAGPAFACSVAVDHRDMGRALDLMIATLNTVGPIPGAIGVRFVKGTKATLGFSRFAHTCIIEVDGVQWPTDLGLVSLEEFNRQLDLAFMNAGIPYTHHWGKNAAWGLPGLVDHMYGNADDEWKNHRSALLTREMADLFSNDFLDTVRLSDYRVASDPGLVADRGVAGGGV